MFRSLFFFLRGCFNGRTSEDRKLECRAAPIQSYFFYGVRSTYSMFRETYVYGKIGNPSNLFWNITA